MICETYYVRGGCDAQWKLLGILQTDTQDEVRDRVTRDFGEYPPEDLVAIFENGDIFVVQHLLVTARMHEPHPGGAAGISYPPSRSL